MERIQAIAQNVSDIAVKVDQLLRHSLILHSKGGGRGAPRYPQEAGVLGGCPTAAPLAPRAPFQTLGELTWGSPTPTWCEGAEDSRGPWRLGGPPLFPLMRRNCSRVTGPISAPLKKVGYFWVGSWSIATQARSSLGLNP